MASLNHRFHHSRGLLLLSHLNHLFHLNQVRFRGQLELMMRTFHHFCAENSDFFCKTTERLVQSWMRVTILSYRSILQYSSFVKSALKSEWSFSGLFSA